MIHVEAYGSVRLVLEECVAVWVFRYKGGFILQKSEGFRVDLFMFVGVMFCLAFTLKNSEDSGSMFSPMLVLNV